MLKMDENTKIYLEVFHVELIRFDDKDFYLKIWGATKGGKGKRHEIYLKMPFSWVGWLRRLIKEGLDEQIERIKNYINDF